LQGAGSKAVPELDNVALLEGLAREVVVLRAVVLDLVSAASLRDDRPAQPGSHSFPTAHKIGNDLGGAPRRWAKQWLCWRFPTP